MEPSRKQIDKLISSYDDASSESALLAKKKWKCGQCTYENWPSALKCTICLTSKTCSSSSTPTLVQSGQQQPSAHRSAKKFFIAAEEPTVKSTRAVKPASLKLSSSANKKQKQTPAVFDSNLIELNFNSNTSSTAKKKPPAPLLRKHDVEHELIGGGMSDDIYQLGNMLSSQSSSFVNADASESPSLCKFNKNSNRPAAAGAVAKCASPIPLSLVHSSPLAGSQSNLAVEAEKWNCAACTYLNWPKSIKCVQCYTPRHQTAATEALETTSNQNGETDLTKSSSGSSSETVDQQQQQQSAASVATQTSMVASPRNTPLDRSLCNSPCTVPKVVSGGAETPTTTTAPPQEATDAVTATSTPVNAAAAAAPLSLEATATSTTTETTSATTHNSSAAPAVVTSTPCIIENDFAKKWSCAVCTYQNWPKSQRCVMCHHPRAVAVASTSSSPGTSSGSVSTAPVSSSNSRSSTPHSKPPVHATPSHFPPPPALQLQMDRLFLAACQGVVEGNMNYLQRFINAGGELTRALTHEEAAFLNKGPGLLMLSVGHTLIHLCCQYKRQEFLIQILNKESSSKKVFPNVPRSSSNMYSQPGPARTVAGTKTGKAGMVKAKFSPCQSSPQLAANIVDRYFSANLRQRKIEQAAATGAAGAATSSPSAVQFSKSSCFHPSPSPSPPPPGCAAGAASSSSFSSTPAGFCYYVNECHTFSLPNDIEDLSPKIQKTLFDELLDRDVEKELEIDARIINWSGDICKRLNSRLYPLWNRHSGDCLLDSVLQACYGVFDTDNTLRRAMAESLEQYSHCFKPRWKEHELSLAQSLDYTLDDNQLEQDWKNVLSLAYQPGASLEQAHIFALCHIFRRPIIIYSVKYVKSLRGENIGFTHFEGVYLPLNWEPSFCFKSPIALGYTRGHFTALVPLERNELNFDAGAVSHLELSENNQPQVFYLPLTNSDGQLLPVHFLTCAEAGKERALLRQYLQVDCLVTQANGCGLYVAHQRVAKPPMLVRQMVEDWLNYYRNMQSRETGYQIEICANDENENCNDNKSPSGSSMLQHHHHHHHHLNSSTNSASMSSTNHQSSTTSNQMDDEEDEEEDEEDDDDEEEEEDEDEEEEDVDDGAMDEDEMVELEEDDDDDDDEYCVREDL